MVSDIQSNASELFERTMSDGSHFHCSELFTQSYLHNTLGWNEQHTTKAAQKLPTNHDKILEGAFVQLVHVIRDWAVPAPLIINTN